MFNPVAEAIGKVLETPGERLFELLEGILEEQKKTNALLAAARPAQKRSPSS